MSLMPPTYTNSITDQLTFRWDPSVTLLLAPGIPPPHNSPTITAVTAAPPTTSWSPMQWLGKGTMCAPYKVSHGVTLELNGNIRPLWLRPNRTSAGPDVSTMVCSAARFEQQAERCIRQDQVRLKAK